MVNYGCRRDYTKTYGQVTAESEVKKVHWSEYWEQGQLARETALQAAYEQSLVPKEGDTTPDEEEW